MSHHVQHPHTVAHQQVSGLPARNHVIFVPQSVRTLSTHGTRVGPNPVIQPIHTHNGHVGPYPHPVIHPIHHNGHVGPHPHPVTQPIHHHNQHGPYNPVVQVQTFCPRRERQEETAELQDILASPEGQQAVASIQSGQAHSVLIHTQIPHLHVVSIRALNNQGIIVIGPQLTTSKQPSSIFARH